jgi:hypothetical protein
MAAVRMAYWGGDYGACEGERDGEDGEGPIDCAGDVIGVGG